MRGGFQLVFELGVGDVVKGFENFAVKRIGTLVGHGEVPDVVLKKSGRAISVPAIGEARLALRAQTTQGFDP